MKTLWILLALVATGVVQAQTADNIICTGCVNAPDIKNRAVTTGKIKAGAVKTARIAEGAVTEAKLSPQVVARIDELEDELEELKEYIELLQAYIEIDEETDPNIPTVRVVAANLQVVNGQGTTGSLTGTGNLIIGYNSTANAIAFCSNPNFSSGQGTCEVNAGTWYSSATRTGSHNVVLGDGHSYLSYGGLVGGQRNVIKSPNASVVGGVANIASSDRGVVVGGQSNVVIGPSSVVSGGIGNTASGPSSVVSGGDRNTASAQTSVVSGGVANTSSALWSTVSGGSSRNSTGEADWRAGSLFENF